MLEERTLDNSPAPEAAPAPAPEAAPAEAPPEGGEGGDNTDDPELAALVEGLDEDRAAEVRKLHKKSKDFDGLIAKREKKTSPKPAGTPDIESEVDKVLRKRTETETLRAVVTEGDPLYIPELVSDDNYKQIIGYLPRNTDRSTREGIHKGLRAAVKLWKDDHGGEAPKPKRNQAAADLATSKGTEGGTTPAPAPAKPGRKLLKKDSGLESWYPKNE